MADDWRLSVDFDDEGDGTQLVEWLAAFRIEREERDRLGRRVVVSRDGSSVFLYADTEAAAREAGAIVRRRLEERGIGARIVLERWHPVEQDWKDAALPLPETEAELATEHARQQAREAEESRAHGHAEWEVRVTLPSREATAALADRLEAEGFPVVRRSSHLLAGTVNRDQAEALAERLRAEAPEGARVEVEPGGGMVWEALPQNPFAVFGGLGA